MTAYWQGQLPVGAHADARQGERSRGSAPGGSLAIGRFMGTVVVTLHGDLHRSASVRLAGVLRDLIDGQGNLAVVVDLADVGGIDRSGLDVLASAAGRMDKRGGALRVGGPTGAVFDALTLAGLAGLIRSPLETAHGARSSTRRPYASRRMSIHAHPAGSDRHDEPERGHAS